MSLNKPLNRIKSRLRSRLRGVSHSSSGYDAPPANEADIATGEFTDGHPGSRKQWFFEHYEKAARETIEFLTEGGVSLEQCSMADIGCGQGITDLGIFRKSKPSRLVGFDINKTSRDLLAEEAQAAGVDSSLPEGLEFVQSESERLPAPDDNFDVVITWSAFEHIANPLAVLQEIRRIIRPHGVLFLQLWPFYHSQHGSHLMHWYPDGYCQFLLDDNQIRERLLSDTETDREWTEMMIDEYSSLNKITFEQLQSDMREAGFRVARLEILSHTVQLPKDVDDWPLSAVGISGVKLLAVPAEPRTRTLKTAERRHA